LHAAAFAINLQYFALLSMHKSVKDLVEEEGIEIHDAM
jgi:hypothetical protein